MQLEASANILIENIDEGVELGFLKVPAYYLFRLLQPFVTIYVML